MADKKTKAPAKASVPPKGPAKGGAPASKKAAAKPAAAAPAAAPATRTSVAPTAVHKTHSFRRKMVGVVTSDKMDKTVVVEVVRRSLDPVYKKYVRARERYKAHDEENQFKVGDRVEITENRPISREKRWMVTRLVARRVEA